MLSIATVGSLGHPPFGIAIQFATELRIRPYRWLKGNAQVLDAVDRPLRFFALALLVVDGAIGLLPALRWTVRNVSTRS